MIAIKIRPMTLLDLIPVYKIAVESFPHPWPREEYIKELTQNRFAKYFVCLLERKIVGFLGLWIIFEDGHVPIIAVSNKYRRKGIGKMLMDFGLQLAKDHHCDKLILEVRKSNETALHFYQQMGFKLVNTKKNYYIDNQEDAWEMILAIPT